MDRGERMPCHAQSKPACRSSHRFKRSVTATATRAQNSNTTVAHIKKLASAPPSSLGSNTICASGARARKEEAAEAAGSKTGPAAARRVVGVVRRPWVGRRRCGGTGRKAVVAVLIVRSAGTRSVGPCGSMEPVPLELCSDLSKRANGPAVADDADECRTMLLPPPCLVILGVRCVCGRMCSCDELDANCRAARASLCCTQSE